jgi:hypothetical protein
MLVCWRYIYAFYDCQQLTGWAKQWYKLHVSGCHGSWVVLTDQFSFAFFALSKIIDLQNEVLNFAQKEGESLGAAWSRYH